MINLIDFDLPIRTELPGFVEAAAHHEWFWCFDCERAFQRSDVRRAEDGHVCAYHDCAGQPLDFWQWDAYRAFVGAGPTTPERERRYPLAA